LPERICIAQTPSPQHVAFGKGRKEKDEMGKVVVSGTLSQTPARRKLKNGMLCATAIVRSTCAKDGNRTRFWQIAAFNGAAQSALMRLSRGDPIVVQGTVEAEIQGQNGEIALSFGVVAERILDVPPQFAAKIAAGLTDIG
jgi:single-stranded DNA-binding protein